MPARAKIAAHLPAHTAGLSMMMVPFFITAFVLTLHLYFDN
jgi:hypothetical protein